MAEAEYARRVAQLVDTERRGLMTRNALLQTLYVMLRTTRIDLLVDAIVDSEVRSAFIADLRRLHGRAPAYDVLFVTNAAIERDPAWLPPVIHEWLAQRAEGHLRAGSSTTPGEGRG